MSRNSIDLANLQPSQINRALGPTENIYFLLDKLYCLNFVVFAEIDGPFDSARLASALQAVQAEHPLLRARVALVGGRPWFKPVSAETHPIQIAFGALRNWRLQIAAELDRPFVDEAPRARFLLLGGSGRKSVAAMVFHHSIADGRSGADVFIEVLQRSAGQDMPLSFRRARPSAQDLDLIKLKGLVGASIKKLAYWLNQSKSALKFAQQLPGFDATARPERNVKVVSFSFQKKKAQALLAACRAHGTTMQGALGAAQVLAINDEFGSARARTLGLNSLADLRGVLGGGLTERDLGLYIATVTTVHAIPAKPDLWMLAADIASQLKAILNSGDANLVHTIHREGALFPPNEVGARMVQALVALAPPSSMLTNVGKFDPIVLGNGAGVRSLAFLVSPPAQHPICVTAATFAQGMHLNLLYDQRKIEATQAQRIAKSMAEFMQLAAES